MSGRALRRQPRVGSPKRRNKSRLLHVLRVPERGRPEGQEGAAAEGGIEQKQQTSNTQTINKQTITTSNANCKTTNTTIHNKHKLNNTNKHKTKQRRRPLAERTREGRHHRQDFCKRTCETSNSGGLVLLESDFDKHSLHSREFREPGLLYFSA